MMKLYIDNKDLKTQFGIDCLDYSGVLSYPAERESEREWEDKSGVDKNLSNIRYEAKEFVLSCVVKASNEASAYALVKTLCDYMYSKGCFVLSLRDTDRNIRECFLCERSGTIVGDINIRQQNSLYVFKLGLKDVNPNAVKYKTSILSNSVSIQYLKGQTAVIYWGDGTHEEITNSGTYTHAITAANGPIDVIVDIDSNTAELIPLIANFVADDTTGEKPFTVQFTDQSEGGVTVWAWDFGDGSTSSEQSPSHTYTAFGVYTVTLQVFNTAQGSAQLVRTNYITVTDSYALLGEVEDEYWVDDEATNDLVIID